ncbi:WD40 repeat-like protein [Xylariaceae sp. FL1272]|nr:WD40 repeat-like protein [Xylariaceae sp. FL1272]
MAPVAVNEAAANKRKRDLDEHAKRKRARRERRSAGKPDSLNADTEAQADGPDGLPNGQPNGPDNMVLDVVQSTVESPAKSNDKALRHKSSKAHYINRRSGKWTRSRPIGGKMLNIDPILTDDEQHLILAYNTSLQVYSAADSLLLRKIQLSFRRLEGRRDQIAAVCPSIVTPDHLWVASHGGTIWLVDWTTGKGAEANTLLDCDHLQDMFVDSVTIGDKTQDVLFVSGRWGDKWHVMACNMDRLKLLGSKVIFSFGSVIDGLRVTRSGNKVAAYSGRNIILGLRQQSVASAFDDLNYDFTSLDANDDITCLDLQVTNRVHLTRKSQRETSDTPVLDLVVGCARGAIFAYNDLLPVLHQSDKSKGRRQHIHPRKYHWHRKAVHSVKWSRDGHYILSGGSESTLVLWQLDTQKLDFLPHLSATIENIVVSKNGAAYALHLDDNSAMILSTAEMKPLTYIAGIQSILLPRPISKDDSVRRIGQYTPDRMTKVPAIVSPANTSQILLCVGNGQHHSYSGSGPSMPMIQALDLATMQSVSKQALTRTNPTDNNVTAKGHPITEPRITGMTYSHDGRWLATTDEWQPPSRDVNILEGPPAERREVYLKLWAVSQENQSLELMTRVNAPHHSDRPEPVFDIAADPTADRFATIGGDGMARLWQPTIRQRDGVLVKGHKGRQLHSWACSQAIPLCGTESTGDPDFSNDFSRGSGAAAFSEDGSVLVCAVVHEHGSIVQVIDPSTGSIRNSLNGLIKGAVQGIALLSSTLVVLSDALMVYDLVLDELRFGVQLRKAAGDEEADAHGPGASVMTHLAADFGSGRFAVAISRGKRDGSTVKSELAIYSTDGCEPETIERFPSSITSLMPSIGSSGFLVLDSAAQIWAISESKDSKSLALAQPLADLGLDSEPISNGNADTTVVFLPEEEEAQASGDEMDVDTADTTDDDPIYPVVVAPQKLAELFDTAPSFAMPPIEDMFYQVAKLFSAKPAVSTS